MGITHIWGALIIFVICPILGMIPLIDWFTYAVSGKELSKLGTGNISVSAAFYHGGRLAGILAVLSEAGKGIAVILLSRIYFPVGSTWEIMALIALVMGRYWGGKGAGATNVTWGILVHNPIGALLIFLIGGIGFTIWRDKQAGRISVLVLMVVILGAQRTGDPTYIFMLVGLAALMTWIYQKMPDDLDLNPTQVNPEANKMFRFFRGDQGTLTLNQSLSPNHVGNKAANLAKLKKWGYHVPDGWIVKAGDDPSQLIQFLRPSAQNLFVVRSSALEEDDINASSAGIYDSFLDISNPIDLEQAINNCFASYQSTVAKDYRQSKSQQAKGIAVIVQKQVQAVFSGVAFSRDPINQLEDCVCIEAVSGLGEQLMSGEVTPQQYRIVFPEENLEGEGNIPKDVLIQIATIAREIEQVCEGIPQDIEWSYDGQILWLLQTRPITTLQPLWTRKIAAEVIPGVIRPLTWSINQPLTCGVWGELFTLVLGKKAEGLDFNQTATLHYHRAYFNATLLGNIFRLMGLPPESLEFLTRGSKFSKPPLKSTLINLPGLWRLLKKEWHLQRDFIADSDRHFTPLLDELEESNLDELSDEQLLAQIQEILETLKRVTFYSILAPLSYSLRQAILQVNPQSLDYQNIPEVASTKNLEKIAIDTRNLLSKKDLAQIEPNNYPAFFTYLAESPEGEPILKRINQWLQQYGYLSQVATDISIPRWQEDTSHIKVMFTQYVNQPQENKKPLKKDHKQQDQRQKIVQNRLEFKGEVSRIYSQLLAYLRYHFLAIEKQYLVDKILENQGDIFFLKFSEITEFIEEEESSFGLQQLVDLRKEKWQESKQISHVPYLVYGSAPKLNFDSALSSLSSKSKLKGIPASAGIIEGKIKIVTDFTQAQDIDSQSIIVVPYTDSGWSTILAQAGGLIAEVGGKLSHGAIIAREYAIPAVMDIHHATRILADGQLVRLDGCKGIVEILS